jgi:hypothetical protein
LFPIQIETLSIGISTFQSMLTKPFNLALHDTTMLPQVLKCLYTLLLIERLILEGGAGGSVRVLCLELQ